MEKLNVFKFFIACSMGLGVIIAPIYGATDWEDDPSKSIAYIANSMSQEDKDFYDLVSFIEELRELLVCHGVPVPPLTTILLSIRDKMICDGHKPNDIIFERLYAEFQAYEEKYEPK
jgi:hypothetical protein